MGNEEIECREQLIQLIRLFRYKYSIESLNFETGDN